MSSGRIIFNIMIEINDAVISDVYTFGTILLSALFFILVTYILIQYLKLSDFWHSLSLKKKTEDEKESMR